MADFTSGVGSFGSIGTVASYGYLSWILHYTWAFPDKVYVRQLDSYGNEQQAWRLAFYLSPVDLTWRQNPYPFLGPAYSQPGGDPIDAAYEPNHPDWVGGIPYTFMNDFFGSERPPVDSIDVRKPYASVADLISNITKMEAAAKAWVTAHPESVYPQVQKFPLPDNGTRTVTKYADGTTQQVDSYPSKSLLGTIVGAIETGAKGVAQGVVLSAVTVETGGVNLATKTGEGQKALGAINPLTGGLAGKFADATAAPTDFGLTGKLSSAELTKSIGAGASLTTTAVSGGASAVPGVAGQALDVGTDFAAGDLSVGDLGDTLGDAAGDAAGNVTPTDIYSRFSSFLSGGDSSPAGSNVPSLLGSSTKKKPVYSLTPVKGTPATAPTAASVSIIGAMGILAYYFFFMGRK